MPSSIKILFKTLHPDAKIPFKKHSGDAGYDLYACADVSVKAGVPTAIPTGVSLKMPEGIYCEIHTRSSQGKEGIRNHLGIVDEGYHGEVSPLLISPKDMVVLKGDRIAQIIFKERIEADFEITTDEFTSDRGTNGFGSTGK